MTESDDLRRRIRDRLAEQRALVQSLLRQRELLQGSLFMRYGECGKEGCACRQGRRHGPYYVLSSRSRGKGAFAYLEARQVREARSLVGRYRAFRRGLRRLKRLNLDLVALLQRYQQAATRTGGRRLGLGVEL
jgi:uncharacterized protein DUF6788